MAMEKSYVSMEKKVCAVCTKEFETNSILLDRRLRNSMERYTVTGFGHCPECQAKIDEGFLALVVIDPSKSERLPNGNMSAEGAWRTGEIIFLKRSCKIFVPKPPPVDMVFIDEEAAAKIKSMAEA